MDGTDETDGHDCLNSKRAGIKHKHSTQTKQNECTHTALAVRETETQSEHSAVLEDRRRGEAGGEITTTVVNEQPIKRRRTVEVREI